MCMYIYYYTIIICIIIIYINIICNVYIIYIHIHIPRIIIKLANFEHFTKTKHCSKCWPYNNTFILIPTLWSRYFYYPHSFDRATKMAQRGSLAQGHPGSRIRIWNPGNLAPASILLTTMLYWPSNRNDTFMLNTKQIFKIWELFLCYGMFIFIFLKERENMSKVSTNMKTDLK